MDSEKVAAGDCDTKKGYELLFRISAVYLVLDRLFFQMHKFCLGQVGPGLHCFEALKSWGPGLDDYVSVVSGRPWLLSRYRRNLVPTLHQVSPRWLLSPLLLAKIFANLLHALDECILEFEFHSQLVTDLFFLSMPLLETLRIPWQTLLHFPLLHN